MILFFAIRTFCIDFWKAAVENCINQQCRCFFMIRMAIFWSWYQADMGTKMPDFLNDRFLMFPVILKFSIGKPNIFPSMQPEYVSSFLGFFLSEFRGSARSHFSTG